MHICDAAIQQLPQCRLVDVVVRVAFPLGIKIRRVAVAGDAPAAPFLPYSTDPVVSISCALGTGPLRNNTRTVEREEGGREEGVGEEQPCIKLFFK